MQLPQEFVESLHGIKGFDKESFLRIHDSGEQVTSIRLNPYKPTDPFHLPFLNNAKQVPWCSTGFYLDERPSFTLDPLFHAGCYYVQEASSMFLEKVVSEIMPDHQQKKYKVLDLCAAPGGKSTHLSALFGNGLVMANEVNKLRASILVENAIKWGKENIIVSNNDPRDFRNIRDYFDLIIVDAPCSGSGLFRKDEEAVSEWSLQNVQQCSTRQRKILNEIWPALKMDGYLIYSTCSYSKEEDEDILDWLLNETGSRSCRIPIPGNWGIVEVSTQDGSGFGYRFFPDKLKGEGFFIACLQKKSQDPGNMKIPRSARLSAKESTLISEWIKNPADFQFIKIRDELQIVKPEWKDDVEWLASQLHLKKAGVNPGKLAGVELLPSHELGLSCIISGEIPAVELLKSDALQYLRKESIVIDGENKGWVLVQYQAQKLGWVKVLANRANNYYPKEWRILKS